MDKGKKAFTYPSSAAEGRQRKGNLHKVIKLIPARTKDNFLLLFLFILGLSGFAFILNTPVGQDINKRSLFDNIFHLSPNTSLTSDSLKSDLLHIKGELKANTPIVFFFQPLSSCEGYKIEFGDQHTTSLNSNQFIHVYSEPGTYKVELLRLGEEKDIVVHCEFLNIK